MITWEDKYGIKVGTTPFGGKYSVTDEQVNGSATGFDALPCAGLVHGMQVAEAHYRAALATHATGAAKSPEEVDFFVDNLRRDENIRKHIEVQMCCNGYHCGCYGATVDGYLAYLIKDFLKG